MNGFTVATFFAKMTPFNWLTMVVLVIGIIVGSGITYYQVHENAGNIEWNRTNIGEMHDTQIILVEEVQDLNDGMDELNDTMNAWMEKLYDQAAED